MFKKNFFFNFTHKSSNHFLKILYNESIFIKPCTNSEIIDIVSDLSSKKAKGPNSIPIKIMKLAKDYITNNLSALFNLSFLSRVFTHELNFTKILPVF